MSATPFAALPPISLERGGRGREAARILMVALILGVCRGAAAQQKEREIDEINAQFHFLSAGDTLLIHEEDGKLNGQINIVQGENESDAVLSYLITIGSRVKNHVEFKTSKVHERYFRFRGSVERGSACEERDPDYLRLAGDLDIITVNGDTGNEITDRRRVVLKSLGANEKEE